MERFYPDGGHKGGGTNLGELIRKEEENKQRLEQELENLIDFLCGSNVDPEKITEDKIPQRIKELKDQIGRVTVPGRNFWQEAREYLVQKLIQETFSKSEYEQRVARKVIELLFGY
jgi:hypothetical protein